MHMLLIDYPVYGKIVAFEVQGPMNSMENLSFTLTAWSITLKGHTCPILVSNTTPN